MHRTVEKGCVLFADFSCVDENKKITHQKTALFKACREITKTTTLITKFCLVWRLSAKVGAQEEERRAACWSALLACSEMRHSFPKMHRLWLGLLTFECLNLFGLCWLHKTQCFTSVSSCHHNHWEPWHVASPARQENLSDTYKSVSWHCTVSNILPSYFLVLKFISTNPSNWRLWPDLTRLWSNYIYLSEIGDTWCGLCLLF